MELQDFLEHVGRGRERLVELPDRLVVARERADEALDLLRGPEELLLVVLQGAGELAEGTVIAVDGSTGEVFVDPTEEKKAQLEAAAAARKAALSASTGPGAPLASRVLARNVRSLPVMSGFCSEPDRANSFSIIDWVRTNHE